MGKHGTHPTCCLTKRNSSGRFTIAHETRLPPHMVFPQGPAEGLTDTPSSWQRASPPTRPLLEHLLKERRRGEDLSAESLLDRVRPPFRRVMFAEFERTPPPAGRGAPLEILSGMWRELNEIPQPEPSHGRGFRGVGRDPPFYSAVYKYAAGCGAAPSAEYFKGRGGGRAVYPVSSGSSHTLDIERDAGGHTLAHALEVIGCSLGKDLFLWTS